MYQPASDPSPRRWPSAYQSRRNGDFGALTLPGGLADNASRDAVDIRIALHSLESGDLLIANPPNLPVPAPVFDVVVQAAEDDVKCIVLGELDMRTGPLLFETIERLAHAGRRRAVIDLAQLSFCDCSGLSALLHSQQEMRRQGGELVITGLQSEPLRLVALTGVQTVLADNPRDSPDE